MSKRKARDLAPEGSLRAALEHLPDVRRGQGKDASFGWGSCVGCLCRAGWCPQPVRGEKVGARRVAQTFGQPWVSSENAAPAGPLYLASFGGWTMRLLNGS